jgi:hypothetical protein
MAIPTATELYNEVDNICQETDYDQSDIIGFFNDALLDISFRVQLPLLEASDFVYTTSELNYLSLPSNYQRDLFSVYNVTTGLFVPIYADESKLRRIYEGSVDMKGDVTGVAPRGAFLCYQHVPEPPGDGTESTVTLEAETISFTASNQGISDSGSALVSTGLEAEDRLTIAGSGNRNDGPCNIATIETDGSALTVDKIIRDEDAGNSIILSTGNVLMIRYFRYPTLLTQTNDESTEQVSCLPEAMVKPLLVNFAAAEIWSRIEQDEDRQGPNAAKYTGRYEAAIFRFQGFVGGDMKPQSGFSA